MRIRPDVLQVLQFLTPCSRFPVFFTSKILLVWFLCLTKVVSTNMVTAELIRFVWFYTWPRWSALLGLLNNHFDFVIFVLGQVGQHQYGFRRINSFCVILCLTKVVNVDRVAAELIVLWEICTWLRWSALIGLLKNHFVFIILCLTEVVCTDRVTAYLLRFCDFFLITKRIEQV